MCATHIAEPEFRRLGRSRLLQRLPRLPANSGKLGAATRRITRNRLVPSRTERQSREETRGIARDYMKKLAGIENAATQNATVLSVGTNPADGVSLERIFHAPGWRAYTNSEWTLITRATLASAFFVLRQMPIPIVLCDCDLMPRTWRELLEHISALPDPPLLIVTSRRADERLWAEAPNLGAYDVLARPFDSAEVMHVLSLAWQHWQDRNGVYRSQTKQRMAAAGISGSTVAQLCY